MKRIREIQISDRPNLYAGLNDPNGIISIQYNIDDQQLYLIDYINRKSFKLNVGEQVNLIQQQLSTLSNDVVVDVVSSYEMLSSITDPVSGGIYQVNNEYYTYNTVTSGWEETAVTDLTSKLTNTLNNLKEMENK